MSRHRKIVCIPVFAFVMILTVLCVLCIYQNKFQKRIIFQDASPNGEHIVEVIQIGKTTWSSVSRLRVRVDGEELFAFVIRGDVLAWVPNPPNITWEDSDTVTASFLGDANVLIFRISLAGTPMQISWYEGRSHDAQFEAEPSESYRLKIISDSVEFLGYIPPTE